ncbi:MAG: T9SS type A sorting domain-containing protein [Candidatus Marinimicrobia bacterium]|nr:T9SS type A sorting domain-containing protein [Candidatus Neomarinimicrobiota bacterium]
MKRLTVLFFAVNLVFSQITTTPAWFNFNTESDQTFPVPFDDQWRSFSAPFEMVDDIVEGTDRLELVIGSGSILILAYNKSYYCDNIRFPSNAFVDFESDSFQVSFSDGVVSAERVPIPDGDGYMLRIETDYEQQGLDTVWITEPENIYPTIPDSVGLMMRSDTDRAHFYSYLPYGYTYWLYKPSDPGVEYHAIFEAPVNHEFGGGDTLLLLNTRKWNYPIAENISTEPVIFEEFEYLYSDDGEITIGNIPFDFSLSLNEYSGDDSTFGVFLFAEEYQDILGYPRFVKSFSPDGIPGGNFHFGWGVGITRWDIAGINVHWDLVGKHYMIYSSGELDLNESLSISFYQAFPPFKTYPLDTTWYQYKIPVVSLFESGEMPGAVDSLQLVLGPEIMVLDHVGRIQLNGLQLRDESNMLYDFSAQDPEDWLMDIALNGSGMYWESCDAQPPEALTASHELVFYNDMQGSLQFAGFAEFTAHFNETVQLSDEAYLEFWMRKAPLITSVKDEPFRNQPARFGLVNAYPNPFNAGITLNLTLPKNKGSSSVVIFDIQGRQIWSQHLNESENDQQVFWSGSNDQGLLVSSGIYIATVIIDGQPLGDFQKLILLK